jgi:hypothetical protein
MYDRTKKMVWSGEHIFLGIVDVHFSIYYLRDRISKISRVTTVL